MSESKLFTPFKVGHVTLQHRFAMAPLTRFRADSNYVPHDFVKEYYEQRASVPGTLLVTEGTYISAAAGGYANVPGIYNASQIAAWKEITSAVHAKGSFIFCQLWALGRAAKAETLAKEGYNVVSSSPTPQEGGAVPRELREEEIWEFVEAYAQAARNAIEAGFDGVEIHGANGYLVDQFTKGGINKRSDGWGGSVEKRSRFGIEVVKAVIEAVGVQRTAIRLSPFNYTQGTKFEDIQEQFSDLVSKLKPLNIAYLHLIESHEDPAGLDFLAKIWEKASPLLIAGAMARGQVAKGNDPWKAAERERKYLDWGNDVVVVYGRYFISNPDLVFRLKNKVMLREYEGMDFYKAESREKYTDLGFSEKFLELERDESKEKI